MNSYPRDEFDDIDENTSRRGAYRGAPVDNATSRTGLLAIIISGVLALIVGGTMYVISPRTAAPEASGTSSATATASASPSAEATPTTNPSSVTVEVYNSSAPAGAAAQATAALEEAGYTVTSTANWAGAYTAESMVYFATGASSEANEVADTLGLPTIAQDFEAETGLIYVVLGADFDPTSLPGAASSSSVTAEETDSDTTGVEDSDEAGNTSANSTATEGADRYSYDPATDTFYLDPAGSYIYDSATGTYQLG